jgi:hypothetical protein
VRARLRRPTPRALRELITQAVASWYIGFFQLPLVPELAWYAGLVRRVLTLVDDTCSPTVADGVAGLRLYRANMLPRLSRPQLRTTDIPVQVLIPQRDPFVLKSRTSCRAVRAS